MMANSPVAALFASLLAGSFALAADDTTPSVLDAGPEVQRKVLLRATTGESGIYRIAGSDLLREGIDLRTVDAGRLNLYFRGEAVPIRVETGETPSFDTDDFVEFHGTWLEGEYTTKDLYSRTRSYFLVSESAAPVRWKPGPSDEPDRKSLQPGDLWARFHFEPDYGGSLFRYEGNPPDLYYAAVLDMNGTDLDREFALPLFDERAPSAVLSTSYYGRSSMTRAPDHHVALDVAGTRISDVRFDGIREAFDSAVVPTALLEDGTLRIRIHIPEDDAADGSAGRQQLDIVLLDWIRLDYPAVGDSAPNDRVELFAPPVGHRTEPGIRRIRIDGFASQEIVAYDAGNGEALPVTIVSSGAGGYSAELTATLNESTHLLIAGADAVHRPVSVHAVDAGDPVAKAADSGLVILTHPDIMAEAERLAAHRNATGIPTTVIDVHALYDWFGHGHKSPDAIRAYLASLHERPDSALKYGLLLGSACKDPGLIDFRAEGNVDYVPTPYYRSSSHPPFPWDNSYGSFDENAYEPSIPIGRIPARNPEEAAATIDKIIEYETATSHPSINRHVLLSSVESNFVSRMDRAAEAIAERDPDARFSRIYADASIEDTEIYAKNAIEAVDQGAGTLLFIGHGATQRWGQGPIGREPKRFLFDLEAVDEISNAGGYPLCFAATCFTGVFDFDRDIDSIGRKLLHARDRGALAVTAASYRASAHEVMNFMDAFLEGVYADDDRRLGDVYLDMLKTNRNPESRAVMVLLGDPSMTLEPYRERVEDSVAAQ